ncbi:hypothetical protein [Streptomyces himalayensis]|uniref:hypothetical protein n=1 Tax=Streptomyces himalayensis TaxID=2820085 RepID=UPI0035E43D82
MAEVADLLECRPVRVRAAVHRFEERGIAGLPDAPRPVAPRRCWTRSMGRRWATCWTSPPSGACPGVPRPRASGCARNRGGDLRDWLAERGLVCRSDRDRMPGSTTRSSRKREGAWCPPSGTTEGGGSVADDGHGPPVAGDTVDHTLTQAENVKDRPRRASWLRPPRDHLPLLREALRRLRSPAPPAFSTTASQPQADRAATLRPPHPRTHERPPSHS